MSEGWSLFWSAAVAIWRRELTHFWRERSRVLGFAATPMLFWMVIGAGFSNLTFFFPGAVLLSTMFTAVFSCMSVIDERREGLLQSVLASPAPRCAFVVGKVAGGATMAALQGVLFLLVLLPLKPPSAGWNPAAVFGALLASGFALTGLGFWMAWRSRTPQGFHALMNVVLMPLWMLSGALFPAGQAQPWIRAIMQWNPLRHPLALLEAALTPWSQAAARTALGLSWTVTVGGGLLLLALAVYAVERNPRGETR